MNQRIHVRVDDTNVAHTRLTVFVDGANCGNLTMRTIEAITFMETLDFGSYETGCVYEHTGPVPMCGEAA